MNPQEQFYAQPKTKAFPFWGAIVLGLFIFISSICLVFFLHPIPTSKTQTIELGNSISLDPSDYWIGLNLSSGYINDSSVDYTKAGDYLLFAHAGVSDYCFSVSIIDTTAPIIEPFREKRYYKVSQEYSPEELIMKASDLSPITLSILYNNQTLDKLAIDTLGDYQLTVRATDSSGNVSDAQISLSIDESPRLFASSEVFVKTGSGFDPLEGVLSVDTVDGNRTPYITVNTDGLNLEADGQYTITYDVADEYGLHTQLNREVYVGDAVPLATSDLTLSDEDLKLLCDFDCFSYELLTDNNDLDTLCHLVEPSLLDLFWDKGGGSWSAGSGFIYDITPEYIYIGSVNHVTKSSDKEFEVTWYDGTSVKSTSKSIHNDTKKDNELALIRIETSLVPADTLLKLKEVNSTNAATIYDNSLAIGDKVVAYAKYWTKKKDIIKQVEVTNMCYSPDNYMGVNYLVTTHGVQGGMSGTGVFDMNGNLVGAVSYHYRDINRQYTDHYSRVDHIADLYARRDELN